MAAGIGRSRPLKTFRSACVCVCARVCELGGADAGSLGHLASAKEKGKLFHRAGRGGGNRNFKKKYRFYVWKVQRNAAFALRAFFKMRVILDYAFPVSVFSGKNACFSSLRSSDGVSAQRENQSVFSVSLLWRKKCGHCAASSQTFARVGAARRRKKSGNKQLLLLENNLEWKMLRQSDLTRRLRNG